MAWSANTPISKPRRVHDIQPTADLNGVLWSDQIGLMFSPTLGEFDAITPPPSDLYQPPPGNTGSR